MEKGKSFFILLILLGVLIPTIISSFLILSSHMHLKSFESYPLVGFVMIFFPTLLSWILLFVSFRALFTEEKVWSVIISKIILVIPLACYIIIERSSLFLSMGTMVTLFGLITFLYLIITFNKNTSSTLVKVLLVIFGIIIYGVLGLFFALIIAYVGGH